MNEELLKKKIGKGEIGSSDRPCSDSIELIRIAKKNKDTIIWTMNLDASERSLCAVRKNNNLLRIKY